MYVLAEKERWSNSNFERAVPTGRLSAESSPRSRKVECRIGDEEVAHHGEEYENEERHELQQDSVSAALILRLVLLLVVPRALPISPLHVHPT